MRKLAIACFLLVSTVAADAAIAIRSGAGAASNAGICPALVVKLIKLNASSLRATSTAVVAAGATMPTGLAHRIVHGTTTDHSCNDSATCTKTIFQRNMAVGVNPIVMQLTVPGCGTIGVTGYVDRSP